MLDTDTSKRDIENRRLRVDSAEVRFEAHKSMLDFFPDKSIFDELERSLELYKNTDFVGLREDTCRYSLLEVIRNTNRKMAEWPSSSENKFVDKSGLTSALSVLDAKPIHDNFCVKLQELTADFFDELSRHYRPSDKLIEEKRWTEDYAKRFLSRLAYRVFQSELTDKSDIVHLDVIVQFFFDLQKNVERLLINQKELAVNFLLQKENLRLSRIESPWNYIAQEEDDKLRIAELERKDELDRVAETMSGVRRNTESIRGDLIPRLIGENASTLKSFWDIHKGEFKGDPMLLQSLAGSRSEIDEYITSVGSGKFYERNIGNIRTVNVITGGFSHIQTAYLPHLQTDLFLALDSIGKDVEEDVFLNTLTLADAVMISLHLPFDGSGRTIEDFFVFLGKKMGYPVTFSVLGYREVGSPFILLRDKIAKELKKDINKFACQNLGCGGMEFSDSEASSNIQLSFSCDPITAERVFDSEKVLVTSEIIKMIASGNLSGLLEKLPSLKKMRGLWETARRLSFVKVPEQIRHDVDMMVAKISVFSKLRVLSKNNLSNYNLLKESYPERGDYVLTENIILFLESLHNLNKSDKLASLESRLETMLDNLKAIEKSGEAGSSVDKFRLTYENARKWFRVIKGYEEIFAQLESMKGDGGDSRKVALCVEMFALKQFGKRGDRTAEIVRSELYPNLPLVD